MSELLSIRLQENEKEALALSSQLSGMPVSKVIMPFISEGAKVSLGAALLFRIDTNVYRRDHFEDFMELVHRPLKTGGQLFSSAIVDHHQNQVPKIIWDFFEMLFETRAVSRLNSSLEEVLLETDTSYVTSEFLGTLCYSIGDTYLSMGGSLDSMNYQLASEVFFHRMVYFFYRSNAKGTAKALSTQWYSKGDLVSKIVGEMNDRYNERTGSSVLEAIVVSSPRKKRGRPKTKVQKELPPARGVMARELR
ncbi:MAG: hypothetical protein JXA22_06880 [Candidatus Thermoplasmatota archaeon]|nr:hypothetical protein [Candidatus Thermoplasmatota archaeon]